ncbi:PREDICTED: tRNA dimethylallyltransferase, mitochondrial isoform X2 [Polistes canadensis]|nr:PREDICTED: tRNA dimethylallyltransferase, mitochondrial isoform X2 [Polistes canadensis]
MAVHHMLDIVDPLTHFSVIDFRNMALPIMDNLISNKKIPIVVGGTNYYIESLLWKILIPNVKEKKDQERNILSDNDNDNEDSNGNTQAMLGRSGTKDESSSKKKMKIDGKIDTKMSTIEETKEEMSEQTNEVLYRRLVEIDPEMAQRLHPNNRRKIIRSLEVFEQYGKTHSEILKEQRLEGGSGLGGPLRYANAIIFLLRCDKEILNKRLNQRVDAMMQNGLIKELLEFHRKYNEDRIKANLSPDYTKGIFQSIGFKEFHDYLILPEEERASKKGKILLEQGLDCLKLVTKRYANTQQKWIRNRFLRRVDRQVPPLYELDCTDLTQWESTVYDKAVSIISAVLRGEKPEERPINENIKDQKTSDSSNEFQNYCEICDRIFIGKLQWNAHINGFKHQKHLRRKRKMEVPNSEKKAKSS